MEGWYVSLDRWTITWQQWRQVPSAEQANLVKELSSALHSVSSLGVGQGDSAAYGFIGQKGDLGFVHFRESLESIKEADLSLRQLGISAYLQPAGSSVAVIEVGLYEAAAIAQRKIADRGIEPDSDEWHTAFEQEMAIQRTRLEARLRPIIPSAAWLCWYPMNKRRGETYNWYALDTEARRAYMRNHGRLGHRYHGQVTQIIGGSVGLDDWEWMIALFADDPITFKKLITDMRFDEASSRFADFGTFHVGRRLQPGDIEAYFSGRLPG